MGIREMTAEVLATARVGGAAHVNEVRKQERDVTSRQDGGGLVVSQNAGAMQDGEPEKRQLQQQPKPKPKPKLQHKQHPEPQKEPKPTEAGRQSNPEPRVRRRTPAQAQDPPRHLDPAWPRHT